MIFLYYSDHTLYEKNACIDVGIGIQRKMHIFYDNPPLRPSIRGDNHAKWYGLRNVSFKFIKTWQFENNMMFYILD